MHSCFRNGCLEYSTETGRAKKWIFLFFRVWFFAYILLRRNPLIGIVGLHFDRAHNDHSMMPLKIKGYHFLLCTLGYMPICLFTYFELYLGLPLYFFLASLQFLLSQLLDKKIKFDQIYFQFRQFDLQFLHEWRFFSFFDLDSSKISDKDNLIRKDHKID